MTERRRKKREAPISYRPPAGMREEFYMRVQLSGLSVNAFITAAALGASIPRSRPRSAPLDKKTLAKLLFQASRISDRLEKELQGASGPEQAVLVQECRDELAEIRTCLILSLGRSP